MTEVAGHVNDVRGRPCAGAVVTLAVTKEQSVVRRDTARTREGGEFAFAVSGGVDKGAMSVEAVAGPVKSSVEIRLSDRGSPIVRIAFVLPCEAT